MPTDHQAPTCGLAPNLDEVTSLLHLLMAQVHELQDLTQQCATIGQGDSHRKASGLSRGEYDGSTDDLIGSGVLAGFFAMVSKVIGLIVLDDALERISQAHWLRAITLGIMGANLGVVWALTSKATWDRVTVLGLAGLDVGCVIGGVLAFGKTARVT